MVNRSPYTDAQVISRHELSDNLVRIVVEGESLGSSGTGLSDEWVSLTIGHHAQSRFYTVRDHTDNTLTIDIVIHSSGLVTTWAAGDCVGDTVRVGQAQGSFQPPADASWIYLVGDLTAAPAIARIREECAGDIPVKAWVEAPVPIAGYFDEEQHQNKPVTWTLPESDGSSRLAAVTEGLPWPTSPGYFWMGGESSQMRAIRKHLMHVQQMPHSAYDVMGYWRAGQRR